MTIFFQVFCAVFSGILSALAIPNELFHFGSTIFAFAALAPLYFAARSAKTFRAAALIFAVDALTTHLLSSYWLANFKDFAVFTLGASAFGTACIEAMAGCLYFFPFSARNGRLLQLSQDSTIYINKSRSFAFEPYRALHFALVRVIYEWAKSTGFLAYPWGVLSMAAFNNHVLAQSADIFGVYGLTFLMALGAAVIGEFALLRLKFHFCGEFLAQKAKFNLTCNAKCFLLLLSLATCYGTFRLCQKIPQTKTMNAVLVQQNMDPWASSDDTQSIKTSMRLSEEGVKAFRESGQIVDLVVWSEAVLRYSFPHSIKRYNFCPQEESLFDFIQRINVPFIIGGPYSIDVASHKYANAALFFDRSSAFRGWYGKNHLVPFAEVIPGVEYPWVRRWMDRLVGFSNGWTAVGTYTLFDMDAQAVADSKPAVQIVQADGSSPKLDNKVRFAVPICFEDAFPDICGPFNQAGAEVFVNITDDSWSKTKSAEYQHFAVAVFRSIEYRTTLVRSTNAGVTAVLDNKGRVLQSIPLFEEGYLNASVPIYKRVQTVYAAFGNWFPHLALALIALLALCVGAEFKKPSLAACIQAELQKTKIYPEFE